MLGENGTGKTTFIRMLAGAVEPDEGEQELPKFCVSYKPQKISPKFEGSVRQLLHKKIQGSYLHPQFQVRGGGGGGKRLRRVETAVAQEDPGQLPAPAVPGAG